MQLNNCLSALHKPAKACVQAAERRIERLSVQMSAQQKHCHLDEKSAQLLLVQACFRHGARTPLTSKHRQYEDPSVEWSCCNYKPTVPVVVTTADGQPAPENSHNTKQVNNVLQGGCHMGQLTTAGQEQALDFGQWLRKRYVDDLNFLPPAYHEGMLHARTTNYQRTLLTLCSVLTGLLRDTSGQQVPVVTSTDVDEILFADSKKCPNLAHFIGKGKKLGKELVCADEDYDWACEQLKELLKIDDDFFSGYNYQFINIYDVISSTLANGLKPLSGLDNPRLISVMNRLATKEFAPLVAPAVSDDHGHKVLRMSMGILLRTMTENMEAAIEASNTAKPKRPLMYLFSGHDSTIMPLLSSLGVTRLTEWPPYLSNLIFELWRLPNESECVVRVLRDRQPLDIPHCPPGFCPTLSTFADEVIGPFFITREAWHEACVVPIEHDDSLPRPKGMDLASRAEDDSSEDDD